MTYTRTELIKATLAQLLQSENLRHSQQQQQPDLSLLPSLSFPVIIISCIICMKCKQS